MREPRAQRAAAVLVAGILYGCAPPPAAAPPEPAVVDVPEPQAGVSTAPPPALPAPPEPALADAFDAGTRRRTWLARRGRVRFAEDGAAVGDARPERLSHPHELVVVAERSSSVRVRVESEGVRLLLFVERADLWPVPIAEAVLAIAPGAAGRADAGVRVTPGLPLDEKLRQDGARKLGGSVDGVTFEGWLPDSAVGEVFDRHAWPAKEGDSLVREGAVVVASAGGAEIARFDAPEAGRRPDFGYRVDAEPGAPPGWQRIRYTTALVEVRGLVKAADCKPRGADLGRIRAHGYGRGHGYRSDTRVGTLPAGAEILAPGSKARVGVAVERARVFFRDEPPDAAGLQPVDLSVSPFGFLHVLVHGPAIGPDDPKL